LKLLTGLPTTQIYHYILESWKIITEIVTITDKVTDETIFSVYYRELKKLLQMPLLLLTHLQNYKWYFFSDMLNLPMDILTDK
jgi:hypothetical protein